MSLALAVGYAAVAALLLSLNLASSWSAPVKAGAIALVSVLYGVTWLGLEAREGWPTEAGPPERFRLQWAAIDEPDPAGEGEGRIYLWVRAFDQADAPPRAHALPFDPETADAAREALALLEKGQPVEGRMTMRPLDPNDARPRPDPDETESPASGPRDAPRFEFRALPPPDLPPKPAPRGGGR